MEFLIGIWSLSIVRACGIAGLSRRAWYRGDGEEKRANKDGPVIEALNEIVGAHPRWGFWLCFHRLCNLGHKWNHKRVWRVYKAMKRGHEEADKEAVADARPGPARRSGGD